MISIVRPLLPLALLSLSAVAADPWADFPAKQGATLGKRIVFGFEDDLWLVLHLMIAGRLHWYDPDAKSPVKSALAAFVFPNGTLSLTEAGTKKRASLHLVQGEAALRLHDPGGLDVLGCTREEFRAALTALLWIWHPPSPMATPATRADAIKWSLERLREERVPIPASLEAYAVAEGARPASRWAAR